MGEANVSQREKLIKLRRLTALKKEQSKREQQKAESPYDTDVGAGEYLWNQAKEGVAGSANLLTALGQTITEPSQSYVEKDAITGESMVINPQNMSWVDRFGRNLGKSSALSASVTGADLEMKPSNPTMETIGAGVEALTDPLNIAVGSGKIPISLASAGAAGIGGQLGGKAGAALDDEGDSTYEIVGSLLGGFGAGTIPSTTTATVLPVAKERIKGSWNRYKGKDAQGIEGGAAKSLLKAITQEQGIDDLESLAREINKAGGLIGVKNTPILVALSKSPASRAEVMRLAKTDTTFMNKVNKELSGLTDNITAYLDKTSGSIDTMVDPALYTKGQLVNLEKQKNKIKAIERSIEGVTNRGGDPVAIGKAASSLLIKKKAEIKKVFTPIYNNIIKEATAMGAVMPPSGVESIYQYVKSSGLRDLFGKGTALDNRIMKYLQPTMGDNKTLIHEPLSFENVDSLKREVNRIKRGNLDDTQKRLLSELDMRISESRKMISGDFNQRLIDVDTQYWEQVGVPFSEAKTVKNAMSPKKWSAEIAPMIIKDSERLGEFLSASGVSGIPIAKKAVYASIYSKSANGIVDPKKIREYMAKNKEVIARLPDLQDELNLMMTDQTGLMRRISAMKEAVVSKEKEIADSFLANVSSITKIPDYNNLSKSIISKTVRYDKILSEINTLPKGERKAVLGSLRRAMVDNARSSGDMTGFWTNPQSIPVLKSVMGEGYYNDLLYIAKLQDHVKQADVSKASHAFAGAEPVKIFGIPVTQHLAVARRPIVSRLQKVAITASNIFTKGRRGVVDKSISAILLDPDGLKKLVSIARKAPPDFKKIPAELFAQMITNLASALPVSAYTVSKDIVSEQVQDDNFNPVNTEVNQ